MTEQRKDLLASLRAHNAGLADFGLLAFRSDDLDDLLHRAAVLISEVVDISLVKVLEHRPDRGDLLIRAGINWQPGVVGHVSFGDDLRSPGGYAMKTGEPVISPDVDAETRFEIPEVLVRHGVKSMVNVIIVGEDRPFGVLEVDSRQHRGFSEDEVHFLRNYANLLAAAIERFRSHRRLSVAAREQSLLARELGHRVKNVLALVQAIASQTTIADRTAEAFKRAFLARLRALSAAESLVFDGEGGMIGIREVVDVVLGPHIVERPQAIELSGDAAALSARTGRMLGLSLHELATNAAKYGALSVPSGRVSLRWSREQTAGATRLTLDWHEAGGPEVTPPKRKGFGTRLLTDVIEHELNGTADLVYGKTGLTYRLGFPLEDE
jgi:two-component sensor histidine kinase